MKQTNRIDVMVLTWSVLLIVSCTNPSQNNSSIVDNPKVNQVEAVNSDAQTNYTIEVTENEVIDGWLKVSVNQQVVIYKIGNPENTGEDEYWGALGTYVQNWEYPSLGINLEMESEIKGGNKRVRSITINQPSKLTTFEGISIGSEAKDVIGKYLKLINTFYSDTNTIVVGSIYGGTIFYLKDGAVSKIFIGAAAE